jgi:hypothetical protein
MEWSYPAHLNASGQMEWSYPVHLFSRRDMEWDFSLCSCQFERHALNLKP